MQDLPSSRGWERGFLPAGGLEDVQEYRYWLTSNAMIWRGVDTAAKALEFFGHADGGADSSRGRRLRQRPAQGLRDDAPALSSGPLAQRPLGALLSQPALPPRTRHRLDSRDPGGLGLSAHQWSLRSVAESRRSGFSTTTRTTATCRRRTAMRSSTKQNDWFSRGGLSIQPNLLAGLMPYLDRDEPEVYLWMFFNSWVACYREEINAMVEHPFPELGYGNTAHPKTSDEANAVMWLRYMFVYGNRDGLFLGRAIPRAWFAQPRPIGLENVMTRWGKVSVMYFPKESHDTIHAKVDLKLTARPPTTSPSDSAIRGRGRLPA